MPLPKQSIPINFAQGLDTKTDPFQVPVGKFLSLENTIFTKAGLLQKRNGFAQITSLPDSSSTLLTTFNDNLTAVGKSVIAYSSGTNQWINKGQLKPLTLNVLPLIRSNTNQSQIDTAVAGNGTICAVYTDNVSSASVTYPVYKYAVIDGETGQNIVNQTQIVSSAYVIVAAPRVFTLGNYFAIVFSSQLHTSGAGHIQYIAVSQTNPSTVTAAADISTSTLASSQGSFDGVVANNALYLSWNGAANSGIKSTFLSSYLSQGSTVTIATSSATIVGMAADTTQSTPVIWTAGFSTGSASGVIVATNQALTTLFAARQFISSGSGFVTNITATAQNGKVNLFYEVSNTYSYDANAQTNYIAKRSASQTTGSLTAQSIVSRSVGLGSKAFLINSSSYMLGSYASSYQPTYFLINSTGQVAAKIAYENGGGYLTTGLPSVYVNNQTARVGYLIKDLIQAVNKDTNVAAGTQTAGIFSQTGANMVNFTFGTDGLNTSEIAGNLHINGGVLWAYDGVAPVEQGFHLYPESVEAVGAGPVGSMSAQTYYYQATYEWSDNNGNVFRSAPSVPATYAVGSGTNAVTVNVPTLRLTAKTANPVKIVLYRWSTAQQTYYQVTSITSPRLNDPTIDSVSFLDVQTDASILGNNIIYTNGGVVENIAPSACNAMTLFQSRLWLISAEDPNMLLFSKQVIENTPVEMSDLFSVFVAPTTGAQGSTGPMTAISSMDDKLIIFKENAIYYLNGSGPDNTGANSQFSEPTFITATVGCMNQRSIVFIPNGLMFQSDKGIWLLGRDLSTSYIGAAVEDFNQYSVKSALNIPGTNQVRFTLSNGTTLMYDYFYNQWGTFTGVPAISSTLYNGLHAYINQYGQAFKESPGLFLDGSNPVLMSFITSWFNLAGLQGFERAYEFYLLATYISPHKLNVQIAYDYNSSPTQTDIISPDNYNGAYGSDTLYGGSSPYGGNSNLEQWRVFLQRQKCQSFQILLNELFDTTLGVPAGAGLTLSGINLIVAAKNQYPRLGSGKAVG